MMTHAAALARMRALRLLFRYRHVRARIASYGGDCDDLPTTPDFVWLDAENTRLVDNWINEPLDDAASEVAALSLIEAILDDAILGSDGTTLGGEARFFHALALVQHLSVKANGREKEEKVAPHITAGKAPSLP